MAIIRGCCSAKVWQELYLHVRGDNNLDLYAQTASARRQGDRVAAIIQYVDNAGLLDMVYTTARLHFMEEILAKPAIKRLPAVHVHEQLATEQERITQITYEWAMGRRPPEEYEPDDGSHN